MEQQVLFHASGAFSPGYSNFTEEASSVLSYDPTQGIMAFNGNGDGTGVWVVVPGTLDTNIWAKIRIEHDYANKLWTIFINDEEKMIGLGFKDNSVSALSGYRMESKATESLYLDDVILSE